MYEIEKGVPIPKTKSGGTVYPFRSMEIGDSFAVPKDSKGNAQRAMMFAHKAIKGHRFIGRTQPDGSLRIWRIK